ARRLAHEVGEPARQLALVGLGKGAKEHVGDDEAEHVVAEKFEALVTAGAIARARERGNMGQRLFEQGRVAKAIADLGFEAGGAALAALSLFRRRRPRGGRIDRRWCAAGGLVGSLPWGNVLAFWPSAHRTIVNRRLQRTDQGQRQISQACSPSWIEKKMICARPTRFSSGT